MTTISPLIVPSAPVQERETGASSGRVVGEPAPSGFAAIFAGLPGNASSDGPDIAPPDVEMAEPDGETGEAEGLVADPAPDAPLPAAPRPAAPQTDSEPMVVPSEATPLATDGPAAAEPVPAKPADPASVKTSDTPVLPEAGAPDHVPDLAIAKLATAKASSNEAKQTMDAQVLPAAASRQGPADVPQATKVAFADQAPVPPASPQPVVASAVPQASPDATQPQALPIVPQATRATSETPVAAAPPAPSPAPNTAAMAASVPAPPAAAPPAAAAGLAVPAQTPHVSLAQSATGLLATRTVAMAADKASVQMFEASPFAPPAGPDTTTAQQLAPTAQTPPARPAMAHHIAQQLSAAISQRADGIFEVSLQPEELGRVRISISTQDSGIVIAVQAERGETVDLMRRHAATLEEAFRDLGNGSVSLSFGQDPRSEAQQDRGDTSGSGSDGDTAPFAPAMSDPGRRILLSATGGLDIRM